MVMWCSGTREVVELDIEFIEYPPDHLVVALGMHLRCDPFKLCGNGPVFLGNKVPYLLLFKARR